MLRLFSYSAPAKTAVTMPAAKLGANKVGAKKSLTIPPKSVDNMPRYGPRIIPIIGAVIAARVMAPPCKPTIGKAGMKEQTIIKNLHTDTKPILNVLIKMKNNGKADRTIKWVNKALTLISIHADLQDPETVKQFIANREIADATKRNYCIAYNNYCQHYGIKWEQPRYKSKARIRKIPTTEKIEMLIAGATRTMSLKLTLSKETGLRPVELCNLKVKDADLEQKLIHPTTAKNGAPRTLKISSKLQLGLKTHINRKALNPNDKLFKGTADNYGQYYRRMRNHLAKKLNDPSLATIKLYDFRHYFATMLYAKTRDILYVQQQMGHKTIETTLIYTQLLNLKDDEWICKTAHNIKDATQLIESGFEYITEIDGIKLFRKRK